eukprot:TRINITY_DN6311_c0_g1_i1.p1 TRINITY_DN6311_c0_g1~~TRINITY_DN6311_c0_g1_i1.p1  ORF type:complete len:208 (+),score=25.36 TRINITY_DN6311_c0_g1_i1:356-979(+)
MLMWRDFRVYIVSITDGKLLEFPYMQCASIVETNAGVFLGVIDFQSESLRLLDARGTEKWVTKLSLSRFPKAQTPGADSSIELLGTENVGAINLQRAPIVVAVSGNSLFVVVQFNRNTSFGFIHLDLRTGSIIWQAQIYHVDTLPHRLRNSSIFGETSSKFFDEFFEVLVVGDNVGLRVSLQRVTSSFLQVFDLLTGRLKLSLFEII